MIAGISIPFIIDSCNRLKTLALDRGWGLAMWRSMPNRRKRLMSMIGEVLREAAVLIGVLAPMETIIVGDGLTTLSVGIIVVMTAGFGSLGLYLGVIADE